MAHPALIAHNAQFEKSVVELAPGMWTAVGFAASNAHMIEGSGSVLYIRLYQDCGNNLDYEFDISGPVTILNPS